VLGIKKHGLVPNTGQGESMSQNTPQNPVQELIEESSRSRVVEKTIEELEARLKLLKADYSFIVKLVRDTGLLELAELYENLKNCSEELTWVLNKAGKRYYYYYLKCKEGPRRSIYIGKTPEGYNQFRKAAQLAFELKSKIEAVIAALRELEEQLEELRANAALVELALSRVKK
jgi:DNA mismatch repair ATPase MutS